MMLSLTATSTLGSQEKPAIGASAIVLGTVASPGVANRTLVEGYVTQPMLVGSMPVANGRIVAEMTLNFEGVTLKRGELNAGVYGEGYVDRRHPHTWLHELVVTGYVGQGATRLSVTVGKGFVPYGTDDPMSRPFVKYPVNHHHAQILERAGLFAAAAVGRFILEAGVFNGDEPESPSDAPEWDRVADSWSLRATARHPRGFELQASIANVVSPEIAQGGGLDHRKTSASARYESGRVYGMAELLRSSERDRDETAFTFTSALAEASLPLGRIQIGLRAERTERPEEERLLNVFRTPRPHSDLSILGRTRWDVLSASVSTTITRRRGIIAPFVEVSSQHPTVIESPAVFEPRQFYGASQLWNFSAGLRVGVGMRHMRMGRYGVAAQSMTHLH